MNEKQVIDAEYVEVTENHHDDSQNGAKVEEDYEADIFDNLKKDAWQIREFTNVIIESMSKKYPDKNVSIHYNTVDQWFKEMEELGVHYVNRAKGEKVYDSLDLKIAEFMFINRKRNLAKSIIYERIPEFCEVRPFPKNYGEELLPDNIRNVLSNIIKSSQREVMAELERKMKEQHEKETKELIKQILREDYKRLSDPDYDKKKEAKLKAEMTTSIIQQQIEWEKKLEQEALNEWNRLDEKERTIKVGLFKRMEDIEKKQSFIKEYVRKNMLERMAKQQNS